MEMKEPGQYEVTWSTPDDDEERDLSDGRFRNLLCCGDIQNFDYPTIFPFYP
jgi:hypothetical protein